MSESDASESVTRLLVAWQNGSQKALDELMPLVYEELRAIAGRYLSRESAGHTLQSTALVHEAYFKLIGQRRVQWQNRAHFFGIAAQMMRRILVDHARRQHRDKRGGGAAKLSLDEAIGARRNPKPDVDLLALDAALTVAGADRSARRAHHRAALLQRPDHRGDRRSARDLGRHGQARVERGAGLAVPGGARHDRRLKVRLKPDTTGTRSGQGRLLLGEQRLRDIEGPAKAGHYRNTVWSRPAATRRAAPSRYR